jgi:serine/threonine-protein phosphatase 5
MDLFREAFCWLPLAHCLNGKVLVVHGGLFSRDGVTLDELRAIDRFRRARAPGPASVADKPSLCWR